jgi:hypothetical protein
VAKTVHGNKAASIVHEDDVCIFETVWLLLLHPCREVGYNHYKGRMGWEMPQTAQMLAANRPEK